MSRHASSAHYHPAHRWIEDKVYRPARAAAGRPDLRWHDLRHTGATLAAQAGATTRELMDRLGHSTSTMAMRYQHVADDRPAEIARRLSMLADQGTGSTSGDNTTIR